MSFYQQSEISSLTEQPPLCFPHFRNLCCFHSESDLMMAFESTLPPIHETFYPTFVSQYVARYRHWSFAIMTLADKKYLIKLLDNLRFFPPLHEIKACWKNIQNGGLAGRRRPGEEFAVTSALGIMPYDVKSLECSMSWILKWLCDICHIEYTVEHVYIDFGMVISQWPWQILHMPR